MAGWVAYVKHRDIFKINLAIGLKSQVYNSFVLPAMPYGADTRKRNNIKPMQPHLVVEPFGRPSVIAQSYTSSGRYTVCT